MSLWHIDWFEIKALKKQSCKEDTLTPPPHLPSWKQEIKLPCEMYAPCSRRMEEVLITRDREFGSKKSICTILLTLILIFLFIFSPFTTPSPSPFVLSVLYKCIVSLPRWYKSFFFGHFLSFSFSFENSHIHVKILYSVYAFFLFIFYQFNS